LGGWLTGIVLFDFVILVWQTTQEAALKPILLP
jgi:hypothetical protein